MFNLPKQKRYSVIITFDAIDCNGNKIQTQIIKEVSNKITHAEDVCYMVINTMKEKLDINYMKPFEENFVITFFQQFEGEV